MVNGETSMVSNQLKRYCYEPELVENYDKAMADTEQMWVCHHRVETIMCCGREELISKGAYYDRPAHDIILLTRAEHRHVHNEGRNNPWKGRHHSDETRKILSNQRKGVPKSDEHKRKISAATFKRWENKEARRAQSEKLREVFTEEHREIIRRSKLGKHFYTNGKVCVLRDECPEGFFPGRIILGKVR